jgi:MoaA/NifB/PqqE/SkfB family radical SAM enzyme
MRNNLITKRARLFAEMVKCRLLKRRSPVVAYLLITDKCNMRCRYCFVDCAAVRDELTTEEWLALIDDLHSRGTRMICFMGGEPLIHKDIDKLVEHTLSKGMICDITTNGILVPGKLDTVRKIDSLMVSLDGEREANDANRGQGSFDKAMEAIRVAREAGVVVRVNAVMTKQSQHSVEFLLDLADRHDLYVTFALTAEFPATEEETEKEILLTAAEIKDLYRRLKTLKERRSRILFSLQTIDYVIDYPLPYDRIILKGDSDHERYYTEPCPFGRTMFYVDANGDFYPCAALWNTEYFSPRNVRTGSFDAAWEKMASLKCSTCFCPGVPEWNRIMSFSGMLGGLRVTLKQFVAGKGST